MSVYGNLAEKFSNNNIIDIFSDKSVGDPIEVIGKFRAQPIFYNPTNSFCVTRFTVSSVIEENVEKKLAEEQNITVSGYLSPDTTRGEYKLSGTVTRYRSELQLNIDNITYLEPTTVKGILAFLTSGAIKGLGPKTAERIVMGCRAKRNVYIEGCGENTLDIIKNSPETLTKYPGITKNRALKIHESYMSNIELSSILMFFSQYDITPLKAMKIYKEFGAYTIDTVKKNPYKLIKIDGFGFDTCDKIARKLGTSPHAFDRIKEGVLHVLSKAMAEGHCYLPTEDLISRAHSFLSIDIPIKQAKHLYNNSHTPVVNIKVDGLSYDISRDILLSKILEAEEEAKKKKSLPQIIIDEISEKEIIDILNYLLTIQELVKVESNHEQYIYHKYIFNKERELAELISNMLATPVKKVDRELILYHIRNFENHAGITLEEKQVDAIITGINSRLFIVTGPAGSGKSTVISGFLYVSERIFRGFSADIIAQCAPTGKAAKRMSEVTGMEAKTIHRLLDYRPPNEYGYNEENKLPQKLLIVDEGSMLELLLTVQFCKAIDISSTRLAILGDIEQLPSIGVGNILKDLIDSGVVPVVRLDVIKRQEATSDIIRNAKGIIEGKMIESNPARGQFIFAKEVDPIKISDRMLACLSYYLKKYNIAQIQVLCPQKKGEIGTDTMNIKIQELLNPPSSKKKELKVKKHVLREGDRVYHNQNNYEIKKYIFEENQYVPKTRSDGSQDCGIFNGETGIIKEIIEVYNPEEDEQETKVVVAYDDCYILYGEDELDQIEHAFALTVHKYQGSQNKVIIAPISFHNYKLLSRNLLYTLVTRAEETLVLIGDPRAAAYAINNVMIVKRNTMLKSLLR